MIDLEGLPAEPQVRQGLADLARGRWSQEAFLLAMAPGRLRELGLPIPEDLHPPAEPELALYHLLCADSGQEDPYYRYNALRRELDSFISALEQRVRQATRAAR